MKTILLLLALAGLAGAPLHAGEGTFGTGAAPVQDQEVALEPIDLDLAASLFSGLLGDLSGPPPGGNPAVAPAPEPGTTYPGGKVVPGGKVYPGGKPGTGATHTVARGDSLWRIAARYCGDGNRWREIYQANRSQIRDPHWIYPGQSFRIPCTGGSPRTTYPGSPTMAGTGTYVPGPGTTAAPTHAGGQGEGQWISHLPLDPGSYRVSDHFGSARDGGARTHKGIDLAAPRGTPIRAVAGGVVTQAGWISGYGWAVYIRHPNGYVTRYGHLVSRPSVRVGQQVQGGQPIGGVNNTGNSFGNHLHFEVRRSNGTAIPPSQCARF